MNERSQELIVDLLDGRLSPAEERAALLRIEDDPGLRAEYEAQMTAMSVLGASATPSMTPEERSTLHAAVREQLHLDEAIVPVVASTSRWQRWWAPVSGLAVAAVVVFSAVAILPGVLSSSDSDGNLETALADFPTTAPAASFADDGAAGEEMADAQAAPPEVAESHLAGGSSADDGLQSTTTVAASEAAESPAVLPYLSDVDLAALESELASDPASLRNAMPLPSAKFSELDALQADDCLESLSTADSASSFFAIAATTYEGTEAVVVSITSSEGESFLAIFAVNSCRELASTQG